MTVIVYSGHIFKMVLPIAFAGEPPKYMVIISN